MVTEEFWSVVIVLCSVASLALALNFFLFSKQPVSKSVAVLIAVGLCVILVVIKSLLKQNNSGFGGLLIYPIVFYFILKKKEKEKEKESLNQIEDTGPAIWNPNLTANFSFLLSPAFSSYLQMLNWRALGEPEKVASARNWYYVTLVMWIVIMLIALTGEVLFEKLDSETAELSALLIWFLFTAIWYLSAGKAQSKYVEEKFGSSYAKKPWVKAVLIGFGALLSWVIVTAAIIGFVLGAAGL